MKLIRLTTQNENCHFSSTFDQDIIVKPDSKIALQTLSMERVLGELAIDGTNDKITYTVRGDTNTHDAFLTHTTAPYTSNNIDVLMTDMENSLNGELEAEGREMGCQFKVDKSTHGKFEIVCQQAIYNDRTAEFTANIPTRSVAGTDMPALTTSASKWYKPTAGAAGNNNTFATYLNEPLSKGSAVFRARIDKQEDTAGALGTDGFIIGISSQNIPELVSNGADITDANIEFGVYMPSILEGGTGATNQAYQTIENGVFTTHAGKEVIYDGESSLNNDTIAIEINKGRISCGVYWDNTGSSEFMELVNEPYVAGTSYYPFIIIRGAGGTNTTAKTKIAGIKVTTDPYITTVSTSNEISEVGTVAPPQPNTSATNGFLQFESADLSDALGYQTRRIPESGFQKARIHTFTGAFTFALHNLSEAFLVQMLSMELQSFDDYDRDNFGGGQKSILSVIPAGSNDSVVYEPNNLIWIDLNNMNTLTLRNIYARIVKSDYSPVVCRGLTSMTILVKGEKE
jgi:hypothetical protein